MPEEACESWKVGPGCFICVSFTFIPRIRFCSSASFGWHDKSAGYETSLIDLVKSQPESSMILQVVVCFKYVETLLNPVGTNREWFQHRS